jgi:hypothetical protein
MIARIAGHRPILREHRVLLPVLLFALINGLAYLFIVPPWQHYDEPGQFEFAWLIANRDEVPSPGAYDQAMRRELAASMIEHGFFEGMGFRSNLLSISEPIWIGISQISDRPLYYALVALPLRLVAGSDVAFQLYLGRFVSLGLLLVTILAAYGVMVELTPVRHPLRWLVPVSIALLPGFSDLMTAINDDVGATAAFSMFLWVSIWMVRRGFSIPRLLALLSLAAISFWTKNTVTLVAVLVFPALLFSLLRDQRRPIAWGLLGAGAVAALLLMFGGGDASGWYRQVYPDIPTRVSQPQALAGRYVFHLPLSPSEPVPRLVQPLSNATITNLQGKEVSLGAWIWASEPAVVRTPVLFDEPNSFFQEVEVGREPTFHAFSARLGEEPGRVQVILEPAGRGVELSEPFSVYYDGIVLAEGEQPQADPPDFTNNRATAGTWGGGTFTNALSNPSAEAGWLWVHPQFDRVIAENFPARPSYILAALMDPSPADWYFRATGRYLFHTFWARFGWGHVPLVGFRPYTILGLITVIGLTGAAIAFVRNRRRISWEMVSILVFAMGFIWLAALMRGVSAVIGGEVFIPSARYALPAIIPTMLVLSVGWYQWMQLIVRRTGIPRKATLGVYLAFFVGLNVLSLWSIYRYYL